MAGTEQATPGRVTPGSDRSVRSLLARSSQRATRIRPLRRFPTAVRVALVAGLVAFAYHYSLLTLWRELGQETPLAYLGLIPPLSLLLGAALAAPRPTEPDIHDRYLDYIVGVSLLGGALTLLLTAPTLLSSFFWLWRLDLLSLPLFAAGALALAFGVRMLWRIRVAVALLFLAWPLPYIRFLDRELSWFTDTTAAAVRGALRLLPVAHPLSGDNFAIPNAGHNVILSIGSACSGVNSGLGFLLIGGGATVLMRGSRWRRLAWLLAGTGLLMALNVVRILMLFAATGLWGDRFALDILHPFVGLAFIAGAAVVMLALMPRFGLALPLARRGPATGDVSRLPRARTAQPVVRARVALTLVAGLAAVAAVANASMSRYELLAFGLGPPRLAAGAVATEPIHGWSLTRTASYPLALRYFGSDATWDRYAYVQGTQTDASGAPAAVTLDVIGTTDLGTFSTYGLEACYRFHNYQVADVSSIDLGGGLVGRSVRYRISSTDDWSAVYWEWPVQGIGGQRYERVILSSDSRDLASPTAKGDLVTVARQMVAATASRTPTTSSAPIA